MRKVTYKKAGVDINKANLFVEAIKPFTRGIGGFGGMYKFPARDYRHPYLVSSTDGVGTKLKIAFLADKHDTVGIDLVGMNVNDVLCTGARPLFFLDYIATGKIEKKVLVKVVAGITEGCRQAGCHLVGGETAEMPGFYKKGEYDLAGFCVGAVEGSRIIDGKNIRQGDVLLGIESSGLHSNGFSLVRRVFSQKELKKYSPQLLRPTIIYVQPVLKALEIFNNARAPAIKGIAHITGGAFYDKIIRIFPAGLGIRVNAKAWDAPEIFHIIQKKADIPQRDLYRTFNMGIGMVLIVSPASALQIKAAFSRMHLRSWVIGEVTAGKRQAVIY
ncbi:MAG: phosphoribosylformylglycinamidine cyclo-ligase [Candidatus Omnitrophota bacterium]